MFCSVCTAAFHDDIKAQFGQIVEMLKHSEMSIRSVGARVLGKLAELREWWIDIEGCLFTLYSLYTAPFYIDVKVRLPQFVEMLKSSNQGVCSSGETVLVKLAEERQW